MEDTEQTIAELNADIQRQKSVCLVAMYVLSTSK